ncbi:hypothetical protein GPECTOR_30g260 [Gonium pectorale]|uniref:Fe/B12 periplasmic-binding domain-containing protein n=1 Tax=Gonium pectorale TaxID=33097 RepID=A0A150GEA4_GONPE|nr:hypothetical protein GPECTOR_30g260 [Gonium pectorale]|eukprot:KXZ48164.1 hypothetical protein GPECTOR_30g260 [Gonium pectorale]
MPMDTHCDWPELQRLPALTADKLGDMAPAEVDTAMSACSSALPMMAWAGCGGGPALLDQGLSPYRTLLGPLAELRPDVILTQMQAEARPDVLVFALCGLDLAASTRLAQQSLAQLAEAAAAAGGAAAAAAVRAARVVITDGVRVFSRPGPWLIPSLEVLVEALHGEAQSYGHEGKLWAVLPRQGTAESPGEAGVSGAAALGR